MKRRSFILNSAAAAALVSLKGTFSMIMAMQKAPEIGIQLYSMAVALSGDFEGTLKMLSKAGYTNVEFAGPYFFSPEEEINNNVLIQQMGLKGYGYYSHTPAELRQLLDDFGLKSPSAHVSLTSMQHDIQGVLEAAQTVGHQYLICPMFLAPSIDEYKSLAETLNNIGEACKKSGIRFGYHNHSQEFHDFEGERPIDVLIAGTDPELVVFELDLFWTTVAGVNPVDFMKAHADRIRLIHIKDMAERMTEPSTDWRVFTDMTIGRPILTNQTIVGEGIIDFKTILAEARQAGIKYFIVESDFPPDPVDFAQKSIRNLKKII